ncbi:MAG: efflux RND transporter periplasmic adaptor subunit [Pseudomonadales bacterium]|nr:efflux RND transporter periplasmic adaptor subunit [Pseudomonadales bacterium]
MSDKKLIAGLVSIAIAAWLLSGSLTGRTVDAEEGNAPTSDEVPLVRGMESMATTRQLYLDVRGQTHANRVVQVKSEISGVVEAVPGEKGSHVKEGDVLCKVAIDTRATDLEEARADLQSAKLEYDGVIDLQRRGLQSEINVSKAKAALESSRARAKRAELALKKTSITAPFDGIVDTQPVEVGDFLNVGQVCVTLIEIDPLLVVGQVAEKNIGEVELGDEVDISLITGEKLHGVVTFIGRAPDAATRTYPVEVSVAHPGDAVRAGLTAEMKVPVGKEEAHLISPASLVLSDEGVVGVRIVDDNDVVHFKPVTIVSEGPKGVWVKGLPAHIRLITVGQEDVFEGQVVRIDLSPLASIVSS